MRRVVDYKTGSNNKIKDSYILQAFTYSLLVEESPTFNPGKLQVSPALLYIQHAAGENFDPTIVYEKKKVTDISEYRDAFTESIHETIAEIFNPGISFSCTTDIKERAYCPYHSLCGATQG